MRRAGTLALLMVACDTSPLPIELLFPDSGAAGGSAGGTSGGGGGASGGAAGGAAGGTSGGAAGGTAGGTAGGAAGGTAGGVAGGDAGPPKDAGFGVCEQGWCWLSPWPMGGRWYSAAFVGPRDYYTGGYGGAFVHWVDGGPTLIATGTTNNISAMASLGDGTIALSRRGDRVSIYDPAQGMFTADYTVIGSEFMDVSPDGGTLFACNNLGCTRLVGAALQSANSMVSGSFLSLSAVGDEAVVAHANGTVQRFNGTSYTAVPMPSFQPGCSGCTFSANALDDMMFVASAVTWVPHAGSWVTAPSASFSPLRLFPGRVPGRYWSATVSGGFDGYDNRSWFSMTVRGDSVNDVDVRGTQGVAAGADQLYEINGVAATPALVHRLPHDDSTYTLTGFSEHDIWVLTSLSQPYRCDFGACRQFTAVPNAYLLAGGPATGMYLATTALSSVRWYDGGQLTTLSSVSFDAGTAYLVQLAPAGPNDVYALMYPPYGVAHWNGTTWLPVPSPTLTNALTVSWSGELWVTGFGLLMRLEPDGGWVDHSSLVSSGASYQTFGTRGDSLVGTSTGVYHWDGSGFTLELSGAGGVSGSGLDDAWCPLLGALMHRGPDAGWATVAVPAGFVPQFVFSVRDAGVFMLDNNAGLVFHP